VVHVHATEFDRSGENVNQQVYDIEREGMEKADRVITVSNLTRQIVIERYGINPDKVFTVYNGADAFQTPVMEKVDKPFPEKVVTFLGRVTFQKGPDYFVEAARKVLQKDKNVRFVMAGSGDMLPRIIRMVSKYRMGQNFHFTGFLKGGDVDRMFAYSDVYVMPSVSEPFGISPLEAMRSSVPVVISRQSGVAEVLHHALKVDFWDVDAMADSIYGLLNYQGLSRMFSRFGREEVEQLKWDNAAASVLNIYQQLI
jgi:glycosyltransferase involved in cell wall biosynthesis